MERFIRLCEDHSISYEKDALLQHYCTFKIGGPADLLVSPSSCEEIRLILEGVRESAIPFLILGKGSNILFSDDGFPGVVLHLGSRFSGIHLLDEVTVACESGASLAQVCRFACEHGLTGLEFAYGIPGSVGGAVYMNAGAYGGELKDVLLESRHLSLDGQSGSFRGEEMGMGYRSSAYTDSDRIVTGAVFHLTPGDPEAICSSMEAIMNRRREKQPLEYPSAGSTFKRPEGAYASALIDQCGLRGFRNGDAMVSTKHAGFVVNVGKASCRDVLALMEQVRNTVREKTGFELHPEVKIVG